MDDIIVTGKDDAEHLENLDKLLDRLEEADLRVGKPKCKFFEDQVEFLGNILDANGKRMNTKKVRAISEMPHPQNVQELRSFLGLIRHYDKHVKGLAGCAKPLNDLMAQNIDWQWTDAEQSAFDKVKKLLSAPETLAHYDPSLPLFLATDASPNGIGAVIYHEYPDGSQKVIEYASKTLSSAEKNYAQIEKEALSIIYGVKKFHLYLSGRKFTLITDHKPLLSIFSPDKGIPQMAASRLQRWAIILASYNYEIRYRASEEHGDADGLSRLPVGRDPEFENTQSLHQTVCQVEQNVIDQMPIASQEVCKATEADPVLQRVLEKTKRGWQVREKGVLQPYYTRRNELTVNQGILLWGSRVVVPRILQARMIEQLHLSHPGMERMKQLARVLCYWPGIDGDIERKVQTCDSCAKASNAPAKQPLEPWPVPEKPWQRLHLDFAGPYLGNMWLIVVDALSCWPEVKKMTSTTSQKTIEVLSNIFETHGLPDKIVTDNGPQFASADFEKFCSDRGVEHALTPPYHPQSNGLAERFVQTFKKAMKKAEATPSKTTSLLRNFLVTYRITTHPTTGKSPSEVLFGRRIKTTLDLMRPVNERMQSEKLKQKEQFDRRTKFITYNKGDQVWTKSYRSTGSDWLKGVIVEKLGKVIVRVQGEDGTVVRRHKNQLRRRERDATQAQQPTAAEASSTDAPPTTSAAPPTTPTSTPLAVRRPRRHLRRPSRFDEQF